MFILLIVQEDWGGAVGVGWDTLEPLARGSVSLGTGTVREGDLSEFIDR